MASSAKKRKTEKEDALVAKTVSAVLEALKTQGVLPQNDAQTDNSNRTEHDVQVEDEQETHDVGTQVFNSSGPPQVEVDNNWIRQALLEGLLMPPAGTIPNPQAAGAHSFTSGMLPKTWKALGSGVPANLKRAIWAEESIELVELLQLKSSCNELVLHLAANGSVSATPKKTNKIQNISQWISAFTIFIDVYIQKQPQGCIWTIGIHVNCPRSRESLQFWGCNAL